MVVPVSVMIRDPPSWPWPETIAVPGVNHVVSVHLSSERNEILPACRNESIEKNGRGFE
ncbi:hypothetical protein PCAR4_460075 [Paraburkholderia caribensis]|nr:hypothetical protein PCAR4_460075 [Paraburkholderia caribensis]